MAGDDVEDDGGFGQPLPPDDRLWRHPSEVFAVGPGSRPMLGAPPSGDRPWSMILVAGLVGALLATALLVTTGGPWSREVSRDVVERVALTPVVSAPTVRGDRRVIEVADQVGPSVALLVGADDTVTGSAVAFRGDGHLLTSAALVEGDDVVAVEIGGERREVTVVGIDVHTGVAVLRLQPPHLPAAVLGEGASVEVGEPVVSIGAASGPHADPVVATGVVSALSRRVVRDGRPPLHGMLQVDLPLTGEAVGGPVVDSRGAVIGISDPSPDPTGSFGFVVPVDIARIVADDIIEHGAARHCWLGIEGVDLDPVEAASTGLNGGALVTRVLPRSPAAEAGLSAGDVVTHLGGQQVTGMDDLIASMRSCAPGDEIQVRHVGERQVTDTVVVSGQRPSGR